MQPRTNLPESYHPRGCHVHHHLSSHRLLPRIPVLPVLKKGGSSVGKFTAFSPKEKTHRSTQNRRETQHPLTKGSRWAGSDCPTAHQTARGEMVILPCVPERLLVHSRTSSTAKQPPLLLSKAPPSINTSRREVGNNRRRLTPRRERRRRSRRPGSSRLYVFLKEQRTMID
jgi:hypothetical protein